VDFAMPATPKPPPLKPTRDLKLDACIEYANASFKTPTLKTVELEPVLKALRYNVHRVRHLMLTPAIIGYTAMQFQRHVDMAALEIEGSLNNTGNLASLEDRPNLGTRASELHYAQLGKDAATIGTPAWDKFVFETHELGAIPVNMLARAQGSAGGFDFLLSSFVIGAWSIFETMTGDLWEAALNINPSGLAHLNGTPNRLRNKEKELFGSKKKQKEDGSSKSVELDLIQFHKFDLRNKMGTILRNRYEFSRLSVIREAYSSAFDTNTAQVDAALKDDSLDALSVVRNVLVHKAAVVDQGYLKRSQHLKGLPKAPEGHLLPLDGENVVGLIKPALVQASQLLRAVDEWLYKHKAS
jgi:hypothetical protein